MTGYKKARLNFSPTLTLVIWFFPDQRAPHSVRRCASACDAYPRARVVSRRSAYAVCGTGESDAFTGASADLLSVSRTGKFSEKNRRKTASLPFFIFVFLPSCCSLCRFVAVLCRSQDGTQRSKAPRHATSGGRECCRGGRTGLLSRGSAS